MTKRVRIENADNTSHQVLVQVWQKGVDGEPDMLVGECALSQPTDMVGEYVHQGQYLVVKEQ